MTNDVYVEKREKGLYIYYEIMTFYTWDNQSHTWLGVTSQIWRKMMKSANFNTPPAGEIQRHQNNENKGIS